jgi:hypothetical protein
MGKSPTDKIIINQPNFESQKELQTPTKNGPDYPKFQPDFIQFKENDNNSMSRFSSPS